jgi:DNA-binding response OmpR family regulator
MLTARDLLSDRVVGLDAGVAPPVQNRHEAVAVLANIWQ